MRPIKQTKFEVGKNADCFNACIASILGLPLVIVPYYMLEPGNKWYDSYREWLYDNYEVDTLCFTTSDEITINAYHIAIVIKHGVDYHHAVVCFGDKIVHDPGKGKKLEWDECELQSKIIFVPKNLSDFDWTIYEK